MYTGLLRWPDLDRSPVTIETLVKGMSWDLNKWENRAHAEKIMWTIGTELPAWELKDAFFHVAAYSDGETEILPMTVKERLLIDPAVLLEW